MVGVKTFLIKSKNVKKLNSIYTALKQYYDLGKLSNVTRKGNFIIVECEAEKFPLLIKSFKDEEVQVTETEIV